MKESECRTIGDVIRIRRKKLGFTQEQVAERMGVTAPAVNKWEKSLTYPDISVLQPLARLLETDLNTLMCFEKEISQAELTAFSKELVSTIEGEGLDAGIAKAEKKFREYPNCAELIHMCAMTLQGETVFSGLEEAKREPYDKKAASWYEKVLECAGNSRTRDSAAYMLASRAMQNEEYERAEALLDMIPEQSPDARVLRAEVLMKKGKTDEAGKLLEGKILGGINEIHIVLMKLMDVALMEKDDERAEYIAKTGEETAKLYTLGGYNSSLLPMELSIRRKEKEKSLKYIREMLKNAEAWEYAESPLYCHLNRKEEKKERKDAGKEYGRRILPVLLTELKNSPRYEFLRGMEEFENLLEEYEEE